MKRVKMGDYRGPLEGTGQLPTSSGLNLYDIEKQMRVADLNKSAKSPPHPE